MVTVGIRALKARLSAYVRSARAGEIVVVTEHGKPVAELRAPSHTVRIMPALAYQDAVDAGWIRPPAQPADRSWLDEAGVGLAPGTAAELLDAERGDR